MPYPDALSIADQVIAERISHAREKRAPKDEVLGYIELGYLHYEKCGTFDNRPDATAAAVQDWLERYPLSQVEDLSVFADDLYRRAIKEASVQEHTDAVTEAIHRKHGFWREVLSHLVAGAIGALIIGGLAAYLNIFGLFLGKQQWEEEVKRTLKEISTDLKELKSRSR